MITLVIAFATANPTHASIDSASWTEITRKTHADAGEVVVLGTKVSGVECFRGTATTDVPGAKLLDVVADVESAVRWSTAGVTEAKLLSRSGSRLEYYQFLDVPGWTMAADRFWFLTSTVESGSDRWALKWSRLEQGGAHKAAFDQVLVDHPGAVEPPVNVGSWVFSTANGATQMTYSVCTDSGGSIPAAVQSAATKKTLPDTLGDVVREARKR